MVGKKHGKKNVKYIAQQDSKVKNHCRSKAFGDADFEEKKENRTNHQAQKYSYNKGLKKVVHGQK